ncbi:MAG TPA: class I SAM-dependent methyltransferase [Afipia sp.]
MTELENTIESHLPVVHNGEHYTKVLAQLSRDRNTIRYLEIGVQHGINFSQISSERALGVDPEFLINRNVAANKQRVSLFQMTSDSFFEDIDVVAELGGPPELSFLDGMHLFEFLLRDFYNTERVSSKQSLIAMHDCLPLTETMINRDHGMVINLSAGTQYDRWWTGDVWKIIPILHKYRPDLKIVLLNAAPTGLALVTNLDPSSVVLRDNYIKIVEEFSKLPNSKESLSKHYKKNKIIDSCSMAVAGG